MHSTETQATLGTGHRTITNKNLKSWTTRSPLSPHLSPRSIKKDNYKHKRKTTATTYDDPRCSYHFNMTGVTSGAGTVYHSRAPEFTPGFNWGSCYSIFSFIYVFCRSLFVLLCFYFWSSCCLFFFDLRILITPLCPSNSSMNNLTISVQIDYNLLIQITTG